MHRLKAKDGLSLINGTQMIVALGAEALQRAEVAIQTADIICALSLEGLKGTPLILYDPFKTLRPCDWPCSVALRNRHSVQAWNSISTAARGSNSFRPNYAPIFALRQVPLGDRSVARRLRQSSRRLLAAMHPSSRSHPKWIHFQV